MRKRSHSREYALQLLYQVEITTDLTDEQVLDFWRQLDGSRESGPIDPEVKQFARELVDLVREHRADIDKMIESCAEHWDMKRMAVVDRNILRLGVAEIVHSGDVPAKVAINEAIELAKKFGDSESSRFVNGVLDQIAKKHAPADKQ
jgi:transcription antitermination factor NusB